jgi:lipid A 3-O-deacylase
MPPRLIVGRCGLQQRSQDAGSSNKKERQPGCHGVTGVQGMCSAKRMLARMAVFAMLSTGASPVPALDGVSLEFGKNGSYEMARLGAQWQWQKRWLDLSAAQWSADVPAGLNDSLVDIGFTPTLRWQAGDLRGFYLEAGIGLHFLSHTSLGGRRFSTAFQFGDHLGLGYRFGAKGAYDLSYRFQHHSNADIKKPNAGMDFHQVRLQYWFR